MDDSLAKASQNPRWLVQHKFNDSVSSREQVGKKTSPFLRRPMGERGKTEGGGGEEVGEEEHKRLLSVISLPLKSPQGRHAAHFPSLQIQAGHFTEHLSVTLPHILFKYNTLLSRSQSVALRLSVLTIRF